VQEKSPAPPGVTQGRIVWTVAKVGRVGGGGVPQNVVWYVVRTCGGEGFAVRQSSGLGDFNLIVVEFVRLFDCAPALKLSSILIV
jgi:hypothetical protein